jgi:hypothetical protein
VAARSGASVLVGHDPGHHLQTPASGHDVTGPAQQLQALSQLVARAVQVPVPPQPDPQRHRGESAEPGLASPLTDRQELFVIGYRSGQVVQQHLRQDQTVERMDLPVHVVLRPEQAERGGGEVHRSRQVTAAGRQSPFDGGGLSQAVGVTAPVGSPPFEYA